MVEVERIGDGMYAIRLTGSVLKKLAKAAKKSGQSDILIVDGCLRFGIAFLMYLFED